MRFEWDEDKRTSNWFKHRVEFDFATTVFGDPFAIARLNRIEGGEERWMLLGHSTIGLMLAVIFTFRTDPLGDEVVRIISPRKATAHERNDYSKGRLTDD